VAHGNDDGEVHCHSRVAQFRGSAKRRIGAGAALRGSPFGDFPAMMLFHSALRSRTLISRHPVLDRELLAYSSTRWRKVARLLGDAIDKSSIARLVGPVLIVSRIQALVRRGALEGRGRLFRTARAPLWLVRFSEVRLPSRRRPVGRRPKRVAASPWS